MSYAGKPITIRGVTYKSQKEAADRIGVTQSTISRASARGELETVGLGRNTKSLTIRGKTYSSAAEAARDLGVKTETVYTAKQQGLLQRVGMFEERKKPLKLGDFQFPSRADAARKLGINPVYIAGYVGTIKALEKYAKKALSAKKT